MTHGLRLPRSEILRGYRAFAEVFSRRQYLDSELIRCFYIHERPIPPGSITVGFAVRNARGAVARNRLRRQLREAYRLNKSSITELCRRHDTRIRCVFLADAARIKPEMDFIRIQQSLQDILNALCRKIFPSENR